MVAFNSRKYIISASRIINRRIKHWILGFSKADSMADLMNRLDVAKLTRHLEQLRASVYFTDVDGASTQEELLAKVQNPIENIFHVSIPIDPASLKAADTKQLFTGEELLAEIKKTIG